jgi:hypothetical protein
VRERAWYAAGVQFFVYGIDDDGVDARLDELGEAHWAYVDRFAEQLVALGATLSTDGTAHTGSIHVLDAADWMLPGGSPSRSPSRAPGSTRPSRSRPGGTRSAARCGSGLLRHLTRRARS